MADLPEGGGVVDVPLAQTGEGIAECELLKWFVQEVSDHGDFLLIINVNFLFVSPYNNSNLLKLGRDVVSLCWFVLFSDR